jgi:hypothetical protein
MAMSPQSMADLQARFQELQARLDTTTKDLSLFTLVPKWSGTEVRVPARISVRGGEYGGDGKLV